MIADAVNAWLQSAWDLAMKDRRPMAKTDRLVSVYA